jgi:putative ABC transport system permease protein
MAAGRFLSDAELASDAPAAVVSSGLGARMARGGSIALVVGDSMVFGGERRVVVGVFGESTRLLGAAAVMPMNAARAALPSALVGRPTTILVTAMRVEDVPAIRASIEGWLGRRYGAAWKEKVSVASNESRVEQVAQAMFLFKLFMGAITGISLLVGGIGIMNVLLASVTERTREIGIRKATGARSRQIMLQFLSESAVIAAAGSLIGVVLGVTAAFGVTTVMRKLTQAQMYAGFSISTFAVAVLSSVSVGLVFGLYPALRAARLSPIEAIRHE